LLRHCALSDIGLRVEGADVELQSVKPPFGSEPNDAVVLRLVNHATAVRNVALHLPKDWDCAVRECDLLETPGKLLTGPNRCFRHTLKPFEIWSLMIKIGRNLEGVPT